MLVRLTLGDVDNKNSGIYYSLSSASYIPNVLHDPSQTSLRPYPVSDSRELSLLRFRAYSPAFVAEKISAQDPTQRACP